MNDLINKLVEVNKKHLLNYYIITEEKDYKKRLINMEIDEYQIFMYTHKVLESKDFMIKMTSKVKSIFRYASPNLYYDKSLVINILNKGFSHKETLIKLLNIYADDIDVIKHILKNNGTLYYLLKPKFKNNLDIIKIAIKHSWNKNVFCNLDKKYQNDFELAMLSLKHSKGHHTFVYLPKQFQNHPDIIRETLKNNGWGLQLFGNEIKSNKEYALMAVKNNGYSLQFVSEDLKNDFDVVLAAISVHPSSLQYASSSIKEVIKIV